MCLPTFLLLAAAAAFLAQTGDANRAIYLYNAGDYAPSEPEPSDAAKDSSYIFGSPECSPINSCPNDYGGGGDGLVRARGPCQVHVDCVELSEIGGNGIPVDAAMLLIRASYFRNLTHDDMRNYTELVGMQIEYNDLMQIAPGTFASQKKLETLVIAGNSLASLAVGTFDGLSAVKQLKLENDEIHELHKGSFRGLDRLTDLDLSLNMLNTLNDDIFTGASALRSLQLQGNNISSVSLNAFRGLPKLETLNLELNEIARVPTDALNVIPKLSTLLLGKNPITTIERSSFKGLKSLSRLYLDGCDISSIAKRAFSKRRLRTLSLSGNLLSGLPSLGKMPALSELVLLHNPWRCDCNSSGMVRWLRRAGFGNLTVTCAFPLSRRGQNMMRLDDLCQAPPSPPSPGARPPLQSDPAPTDAYPARSTTRSFDASLPVDGDSFPQTTGQERPNSTDQRRRPVQVFPNSEQHQQEEDLYDISNYPYFYSGDDDSDMDVAIQFDNESAPVKRNPFEMDDARLNKTRPAKGHEPSASVDKVDLSVIVAIAVAMGIGLAALVVIALRAFCHRGRLHSSHDFHGEGAGVASGKRVCGKCVKKKQRRPMARGGQGQGNGADKYVAKCTPTRNGEGDTNGAGDAAKASDGNDNYQDNANV